MADEWVFRLTVTDNDGGVDTVDVTVPLSVGGATVNPAAIATAVSSPISTRSAGASTTPLQVSVTTTLPAASKTLTTSKTPAVIAAASSVPSPSASTGGLFVVLTAAMRMGAP